MSFAKSWLLLTRQLALRDFSVKIEAAFLSSHDRSNEARTRSNTRSTFHALPPPFWRRPTRLSAPRELETSWSQSSCPEEATARARTELGRRTVALATEAEDSPFSCQAPRASPLSDRSVVEIVGEEA